MPRIPISKIPKLASRSANTAQDERLVAILKQDKRFDHKLTLYPNAWMKAFHIHNENVQEHNENIVAALRERETAARLLRNQNRMKTMGANKLALQPINMDYVPKDGGRKIQVYAADKETRIEAIKEYKEYCSYCDECYERWKMGDYSIEWPPGAFLPFTPPRFNLFGAGDPYCPG